MDMERARYLMIEQQIRPAGVIDPQVLEILALVKRERFVAEENRAFAFAEALLPIGNGQSMLEPKIEGRILQALALKGTESVLEIGAGSGYMAALLAARAEWVRTLEIDPDLARLAHTNLEKNGVFNVITVETDGSTGWAERAPYDVIVASGSVLRIPQAWLDQLKVGGRLFAVVGADPVMQARLVTRVSEDSWHGTTVFETNLPPLHIKASSKEFVL
ncbi:protein-L-isoaspartate O-methyltransferase family protein [Uliginosibacterium gangwonense]|uniref:protein-L-isoaspartate O-methyltransferase family protein n=1 Tax=Uliginosibacterium gangwonense TaxID=392736 RepID=UPI000366E4A1|nr:protein-L-isoaspartate O-methyltransferase [Uliginosibacterium gangwonense]